MVFSQISEKTDACVFGVPIKSIKRNKIRKLCLLLEKICSINNEIISHLITLSLIKEGHKDY